MFERYMEKARRKIFLGRYMRQFGSPYTEQARRTMFFGRYEASQLGSPYIESEHLLLGLLREDEAIAHTFLPHGGDESIRKEVEGQTVIPEKVSTSVADLPLSNECKRILAYAAEEAGTV
jgi:ATP-dependent Clp protease ATP-binding subunit ClpC